MVLLYSLGCIQTLPTCQTLMTLITLIIESFLSSEQITLTLSVQRPYLLTYSYDIALLYSLGCIRPIPTCRTLITLITLIIESFLSSEQITLTLSVQRPYLLTYSYDVVLLYSLGCIHPIPTCQTLITLITLLTESFLTIWTDNVQLPVNGPCKSRYLAINVICTTVLSLNIQLYNCIAVFPRLHPNTTYMPNTDDTDYTDNRVVFIIWTDNVNAICTTTISSDIQLWYCIAVFHRLYLYNNYLPNTDYTDYTDNRVVFIIWTDNVNAICTPTISSHIQLWCCIAVFPRLYPSNTYLPNTDYTDYTDNRAVFIIWTDNVNAICATTISSNLQLRCCIAVSLGCIYTIPTCQTLITLITLLTESFVTICTDNVDGPLAALNWNPPLRVSGGYFLAVRAHFHWIKEGQEGRQEDHQEGYFHDRYRGNAIIYPQTLS